MSGDQLAHWLTEEEVSRLPPGEALVWVVVRSARLDGAWTVWPGTVAEAGDLLGSVPVVAEAVAAAFALNAEIEASNPDHTTAHLSAERIAGSCRPPGPSGRGNWTGNALHFRARWRPTGNGGRWCCARPA
ncbi:hypothetical protein OG413_15175 [Streptomyces sp. NBC_01433]|uniref:hypothetical protein n=1 Tax=Streptomyces sp. NBC_01433 TaxID=2903864 RepID=UPI0022547008|nr:hypothetical protein [Streptomyces sp. NBC_01433]MCX4676625.1 hypothetical protein [Streptomyces sp. NBC_01433]